MKATGIVRRMDDLGRVVIPMELRRTLGIDKKDPIEILVDGDMVCLRKYVPSLNAIPSLTKQIRSALELTALSDEDKHEIIASCELIELVVSDEAE